MAPPNGTRLMRSQRERRESVRAAKKQAAPPTFPQAKASEELHRKGHPCAASLCGILIPDGATFCGSCFSRIPKPLQLEMAKVNFARSQAHAAKDHQASHRIAGRAKELLRRAVKAIKQKRAQEAEKIAATDAAGVAEVSGS